MKHKPPMYVPAKVAQEILGFSNLRMVVSLIASKEIKGEKVKGNGPTGSRWKIDLEDVLKYKNKLDIES